jgi:small subunit ribosomal protein S6
MSLYESTFIARQDISTSDVEKLTESFSKIITDNGGKVCNTEYWGLRSLAYMIKKNKKGHYVMLSIDAPSAAIQEMSRRIKLNEDVIRNVTFRVDALITSPSAMMKGETVENPVEQLQILTNNAISEEEGEIIA